MKLVIFNGSPHGSHGNTEIFIREILKGFDSVSENNSSEVLYLFKRKNREKHLEAFSKAEIVIIAFPLYVHAMPSIVKELIEALQGANCSGKKIGFIIQSGFPEPNQSRFCERYLETVPARIGADYLGTLIRGDSEGIKMMPPFLTRKTFKAFNQFGVTLAQEGIFDSDIIHLFARRETMSAGRKLFFRFAGKIGLSNIYWNMNLKKNEAFDKRFDKPYS